MSGSSLPLVFVMGERAVCHLVDASAPAGDLLAQLPLYLATGSMPTGGWVWSTPLGQRPLDPARPIGEQVPAEAWIEAVGPAEIG
ncbi:MAG TPA: hypothetical protein VM737_04215 [Gemmatimonadota bacterium]|nr:hypothetical protein [Gemmatimonadota bacterium]